VASPVGTEPASSGARSAIDVGTEEKHSRRRKRMARAVVVVVAVVAAGVGWQRAVEDQLGLCPFLACKDHPGLDSYREHRCRFELGRRSYRERRTPALESERGLSRDCGVSEVQARATSP